MEKEKSTLLSIIELGGYPDFTSIYQKNGYNVVFTDSVRKAVKLIKSLQPEVVVAEFNFQSDFRDRTSSLETVFSGIQGVVNADVIVFYEKEFSHQYERLLKQYTVYDSLAFPVDEGRLDAILSRLSSKPE